MPNCQNFEYEEVHLLRCKSVLQQKSINIFEEHISYVLLISCFVYFSTLVPLKCQLTFTRIHNITSWKKEFPTVHKLFWHAEHQFASVSHEISSSLQSSFLVFTVKNYWQQNLHFVDSALRSQFVLQCTIFCIYCKYLLWRNSNHCIYSGVKIRAYICN